MAKKALNQTPITIHSCKLGPASCGADMSNGSERGEFAPMQELFKDTGRPHRAINIMFTYYPYDKGWPKRARDIVAWKPGMQQWDLPFDDYFPYLGSYEKKNDSQFILQAREVRKYGSDVHLTLTIDPACAKDEARLRSIAKDLRPLGRVFFRINHECNGEWFQHNKRFKMPEVAVFFKKFTKIIHEEAPLVQTVFCVNGFENPDQEKIEELAEGVKAADILSIDRYLSLHYGWPNAFDSKFHFRDSDENWLSYNKRVMGKFKTILGVKKLKVTLAEINADADVEGLKGQAERIKKLYTWIANNKIGWISALTLYQFRDRGGLGLELEDDKTGKLKKKLPALKAYREVAAMDWFQPKIKVTPKNLKANAQPKLIWTHSEDAQGLALQGKAPKALHSATLMLPESHYLIECNGQWQCGSGKKGFKLNLEAGKNFSVRIFCPPVDGENDKDEKGEWKDVYTVVLDGLPVIGFELN